MGLLTLEFPISNHIPSLMLLNPLFPISKLQAILLQQQSFLQKCEAWMDFLSQTEQKLAAEISGNYQSLLEQQRDHEVNLTELVLISKIDLLGPGPRVSQLNMCVFLMILMSSNICFRSCSRQRCSAGNRFCTPSSVTATTCWTTVRWTTGNPLSAAGGFSVCNVEVC